VVGEPGHPPLIQFSDSLILSPKAPSTMSEMYFELVLRCRESVVRIIVLDARVFVFLFGLAKLGLTAVYGTLRYNWEDHDC